MLRTLRTLLVSVALTAAFCTVSVALPGTAAAQASTDRQGKEIGSSPKGAVGLGLIGAEIGLVAPAAFGLTDTWAQITFPLVGAAAGGALGYFLIDSGNDSGTLGVSLTTAGIILAVPSMVLAMSLGRYDPESAASDAQRRRAQLSPEQRARLDAGPGLVRVSDQGTFVSAPAIEVGSESAELGGGRRVRVALLSGAF